MRRIVAGLRGHAQGTACLNERGVCLAKIPGRQLQQLLGRNQFAPRTAAGEWPRRRHDRQNQGARRSPKRQVDGSGASKRSAPASATIRNPTPRSNGTGSVRATPAA